MPWYQIFEDGIELEARRRQHAFILPNITLKSVHNAVPRHLFIRSTSKSLFYISRHLLICSIGFILATQIDSFSQGLPFDPRIQFIVCYSIWLVYWGLQGFVFAGIWCLGPEFPAFYADY